MNVPGITSSGACRQGHEQGWASILRPCVDVEPAPSAISVLDRNMQGCGS